jgi:hypothetical protein
VKTGIQKEYSQTNKDGMKRIDILQLSFVFFTFLHFKVISLDSRLRGNDIGGRMRFACRSVAGMT